MQKEIMMKHNQRNDELTEVLHAMARVIQMPKKLEELEGQLNESLKKLHKNPNGELEERIRNVELRIGTTDVSLGKLAMLTDGYFREKIVTPVTERLMNLYDVCNQMGRGDIAVLSAMEIFTNQLLEELERFGVRPIEISEGQTFDPVLCKPIRTVRAYSKDEHETISSIEQVGFHFYEDGKVIRHARVVVKLAEMNKNQGDKTC